MEVIDFNNQENQRYRLSGDAEIALTRSTCDFDLMSKDNLMLKGCCLILIESGKSSFLVSGEECKVEEGEIVFVNYGQRISDIMVSANFQFRAFFMSLEFTEKLVSRINLNWRLRSGMMLYKYAKSTLNEAEISSIQLYYDLLDSKRTYMPHEKQEIDALCAAFGYYTIDVVTGHGLFDIDGVENTTCERNVIEQHFERFMHLLVDSPTIERKVNVYAEKLCITPKYLNIICHKAVQQTPSALIDKEITQRATKMLNENTYSIKQIAQQLGFNNQSHFGTFMRRMTGKSPNQLKGE